MEREREKKRERVSLARGHAGADSMCIGLGYTTAEVQAFRQTIGAFVYHDLRKSNDVVIILVQGRWSHRPPLMYPETEQ